VRAAYERVCEFFNRHLSKIQPYKHVDRNKPVQAIARIGVSGSPHKFAGIRLRNYLGKMSNELKVIAPQLTPLQCRYRILSAAMKKYLQGAILKPPDLMICDC
jgi:hypothetical protein